MTMFRPIPRANGPIYSFVPIERVRPPARVVEASKPSKPPMPKPLTVRQATLLWDLLAVVGQEFGCDRLELMSRAAQKGNARARQVFCWIAHHHYKKGFKPIGRLIGRDHSTVMYAVRKVSEHREEFEPYLSRILAKLPPEPIQTLQEPTQ